MRIAPNIILSAWVTALFLTATMGFSVHYCVREKESHLLIFYAGTPCHNVHDHTEGPEASSEHDENCCSTEIFSIHDPSLKGSTPRLSTVVKIVTPPHLFLVDTQGLTNILFEDPVMVKQGSTNFHIRSVYEGGHLVPLRL
ncbi:MAG: hypothetical protein GX877_06045 [Bacteroidales bacterium]|nr:hypothetical protein [Bacteroidales bacterium]